MPAFQSERHFSPTGRFTQSLLALVGVAACLTGVWFAGRIGASRLLGLYGMTSNVLPAVDEAIKLSPSDPEGHYMRARALQNVSQLRLALTELEQSTALQPRNFAYWMELGNIYDLAGRSDEALTAVNRAINVAPYYAQPHWQLGNLLLRKGQREQAFAEFRLAVNSDSSLMPNVVDLAWGAFNGDAPLIEKTLQPNTPSARLALAIVFARRKAFDDAMRLFDAADRSDGTRNEREVLLAELMNAKRYYEAWRVWAVDHEGGENPRRNGIGTMTNGGFEQGVSFTEVNFGWRLNPEKPMVSLSLDSREPFADATSLQIRWEGKSSPSVYTAAQLVLVEPGKRYRLSFAARTSELVSGGVPEVLVLSDVEGQLLASTPIPQGTTAWKNYTLEFSSPAASRTVQVVIRRRPCQSLPCPAFGTVWFDAFVLQSVS
jgi:Tetratricopeptide repeat